MGATYTRQSSSGIVDGGVIEASDINNEFDQLLAAFAVSTGHTHDGTTAEGGPITKMLGTSLTFGDGTAGTDITMTFDGETSDGVLYWMEDEDHFKFADDVVMDSSKRLYLYDEGGEYIYGDGTDLYLTSGADINIPANIGMTFGDDGEKIEGDGTDLTITGNNIKLTATADVVIPADVGITFGTGEKIEGDSTDLTVTSGADINLTATSDVNIPSGVGVTFGDDGEKIEGDGTNLTVSTSNNITVDAAGDIILDADGGDVFFKDGGTTFGSATNTSGNLIIKSGTTTALTFSGANVTLAGDLTISGDDLTMGTNTSGAVLVADGTNFNPVVISGDISIGTTGTAAIGSDVIVNADINSSAAIADSKLATISTADKVAGGAIQIDSGTDGTSITLADTDKFLVDDGGTTKYINASQLNTYTSGSVAADNIGTGDSAVTIATSSGAITIDAQAGDADIIFKGTDSSSDITALTLDMSEAGAATFNDKVVATELDISGNMDIDGTSNLDAVDIDGAVQIDGTVTVGVDDTGLDVKFFGATSGSYILWDESADSLLLTDSTPIKIGDSQDLTLYHDGTNSYITNAVGALKIATETSGIAVTIGHTTSETTIADNATVTGNLSVGGNFDVTGSFDMSDADITNIGSIALDSITNDGTDITLDSSNDIVIDAEGGNVEFKDAGTLQFTIDMDGTAGAQVIKLGVDSDDLVFQQYDGNEVMRIADNRKVYFYDEGGEHISSDGTDFTFASGNDINLTATTDINVPADVGMTFGNDGEKIEGDGTDLTIVSSGVLNLAAGGTTNQVKVTDGAILPITDNDVDLGSASYQFKNAWINGTLEADAITIGGTAVTAGGATAGFALAMAVAL